MGAGFYIFSGLWAVFMLFVFIQAVRLSYRIETRSPELVNKTGLPQRAQIFHTVTNRKVARDKETQAMRQQMNLLLFLNLIGFAVFWIILYASGAIRS